MPNHIIVIKDIYLRTLPKHFGGLLNWKTNMVIYTELFNKITAFKK